MVCFNVDPASLSLHLYTMSTPTAPGYSYHIHLRQQFGVFTSFLMMPCELSSFQIESFILKSYFYSVLSSSLLLLSSSSLSLLSVSPSSPPSFPSFASSSSLVLSDTTSKLYTETLSGSSARAAIRSSRGRYLSSLLRHSLIVVRLGYSVRLCRMCLANLFAALVELMILILLILFGNSQVLKSLPTEKKASCEAVSVRNLGSWVSVVIGHRSSAWSTPVSLTYDF
jgi:hypothetical protein